MDRTTRIHASLDGDLPRNALSAAEEMELLELEREIGSVIAAVRTAPVADLTPSVMARLPERAPTVAHQQAVGASLQRAWTWFWAPRQFRLQLRPPLVCAATVALVAFLSRGPLLETPTGAPPVTVSRSAPSILVQFRLDAPQVSSVSMAGSFSGWEATIELRERAPGIWTALVPLTPGVHDYLFLVDDAEWVVDPSARPVEDGFGGLNSRLFLTLPSTSL